MWPGVYRIVGAPTTGRQRAMAAARWGGPGAAISHTTAARLLRLDGIRHEGPLHLTLPRGSGRRAHDLALHRSDLGRGHRVTVDGISCTSATRTIADCAALVDAESLELAFDKARRLGLTSVRAIAALTGRGHPGSSRLRELLGQVGDRPRESRLEVKLARLLRTSNLPPPVAQFRIGRFRVDYAWPPLRVVCECDGFEWHGSRLQWKRDRRRIAAIEAAGWRVVHVTWEDVTRRPAETIARLELAVRRAA
jgi:very-short-patch-repair endonuclease